jgi:uncharacterized protein YdiU (UPF0061 family)
VPGLSSAQCLKGLRRWPDIDFLWSRIRVHESANRSAKGGRFPLAISTSKRKPGTSPYARFQRLDGRHPFKQGGADCLVDYRARRRHDAEVAYLNFGLAREMGLIPADHPDRLTAGLRRAVLDQFALVIFNEHDFLHGKQVPTRDLLPGSFMATRYLQLQHPGRLGATSGDGRSIWNGCVRHRGVSYDVSSCGTGVTRLCPATAETHTFFATGNGSTSYGCGTAALAEGINAALMSEVFHRNGVATERVLAVLSLPRGLAINVRAAPSLLRPSHFFVHLHQENRPALAHNLDAFIDRQVANGRWPHLPEPTDRRARARRYGYFAKESARTFAQVSARFESDYVFVWMDWDGDNILADGGIIDYGSVRQFGLCHREYRFEDVDRMSTSLPEQRRKARHIVKKFAQIRDYLVDGKRRGLRAFDHDPILTLFDAEFAHSQRRQLVLKLGFSENQADFLLARHADDVSAFASAFRSLERVRSSRGPGPVADGLSWDAVYCMRDLLRVLPAHFCAEHTADEATPSTPRLLSGDALLGIALSDYASRKDRAGTPYRRRVSRRLQRRYLALVEAVASHTRLSQRALFAQLAERSAVINRDGRMTGDSIDYSSQRLIRRRRELGPNGLYRMIRAFVDRQDLDPDHPSAERPGEAEPDARLSPSEGRLLRGLLKLTHSLRESL